MNWSVCLRKPTPCLPTFLFWLFCFGCFTCVLFVLNRIATSSVALHTTCVSVLWMVERNKKEEKRNSRKEKTRQKQNYIVETSHHKYQPHCLMLMLRRHCEPHKRKKTSFGTHKKNGDERMHFVWIYRNFVTQAVRLVFFIRLAITTQFNICIIWLCFIVKIATLLILLRGIVQDLHKIVIYFARDSQKEVASWLSFA